MSAEVAPVDAAPPAVAAGPGISASVEDARRAGFYPLVLLLERLQPGRPPIGASASPDEEGVRFRHAPDLVFSAADILAVEERSGPSLPDDFAARPAAFWQVTTTFLGLTGCVSPLPSYFSEELLQDDAEAQRLRDFLDLFHHRLLSLLYRTQARLDLPNALRADCNDAWSQRLLSLLGFDGVTAARGGLHPLRLLRLAPLLGDGEVTARVLEVALEDLLEGEIGAAAVSVEQFVGAWAEVHPSQLTRLGRAQSQLGVDLLLGRRIYDRAGKFRVTVGPLTRAVYARLLQPGSVLSRVEPAIAALTDGALEHELVLWLQSEAAPALQLSARGRTRLGRNSWLGSQVREARLVVNASARPAG